MNRRIVIELEGDTEDDLDLALAVVCSKVKQGFTSGHDSNDTGNYRFDVSEDTCAEEEE